MITLSLPFSEVIQRPDIEILVLFIERIFFDKNLEDVVLADWRPLGLCLGYEEDRKRESCDYVSQFHAVYLHKSYSTVTDLARFLGLSTSVPLASATWYASSCNGIV